MTSGSDPFLAALAPAEEGDRVDHGEGPLTTAPSVYLWGTSRPLVNLVLYALAARIDPEFAWLHVSDRGNPERLDELLNAGWAQPQIDSVDLHAEELRPARDEPRAAIAGLLEGEEAAEEVERLRSFLLLPATVQQVVSRHLPSEGPRVIAIPNADRVADLYAGRTEQLRELLATLGGASVSLMVARANGPGPQRELFDYVFEVEGPSLRDWPDGRLVVEHAPPENVGSVGRAFRLDRMPWAIDVLGRVPERPGH